VPHILIATIPTHRADITCEADIAEEVARFYGYNNIPARYTQEVAPVLDSDGAVVPHQPKTPSRIAEDYVKQIAAGLGYFEACTFPFESPRVFEKLCLGADSDLVKNAIPIKNPLTEDFSIMRTQTVGAMLESLAINHNRGNDAAALFETACAYIPEKLPLEDLPTEVAYITLAAYGAGMDFFSVKGDVIGLLEGLPTRLVFSAFAEGEAPAFLHPGRCAEVFSDHRPRSGPAPVKIGYIGEIHPAVAENYNLSAVKPYVAVLEMAVIQQLFGLPRLKFAVPSSFPPIRRDIAFTVPSNVAAADAEAIIKRGGGSLLQSVVLFDVYEGEQIQAGHKSMAYALNFRAADRTLTDDDVSKPMANILDGLNKKLGAMLR